MTWTSFVTIVTAVLTIIPDIVTLVREGQLKTAAREEIINALFTLQDARTTAAADARASTAPSGVPDPNDRAGR
jgi:hypothetical protein